MTKHPWWRRLTEEKKRQEEEKTNKGNSNDVSPLFVLSQCVTWFPAWRFCTTWTTSFKEPKNVSKAARIKWSPGLGNLCRRQLAQLAVRAGLELGPSEFQVQRSKHPATLAASSSVRILFPPFWVCARNAPASRGTRRNICSEKQILPRIFYCLRTNCCKFLDDSSLHVQKVSKLI